MLQEETKTEIITDDRSNKEQLFKIWIDQNENGTLRISDEVQYDVREVITENRRLYHSCFKEKKEPDGTDKVFYNIGWVVYDNFDRNVDLDTKDINVWNENGEAVLLTDLLKMGLKTYLKKKGYNQIINDLKGDILANANVVAKKVKGKPVYSVNLLNLVIPSYARDIQSTGCAEKLAYNWEQIKQMKDELDSVWDKVELLRNKMILLGIDNFVIYEWWTWITGKDGKTHKGCRRYLDMRLLTQEDFEEEPAEWTGWGFVDEFVTPRKVRRATAYERNTLGEFEEIFPYVEGWFLRIPDRWLSLGIFEKLAGQIEDYNEKANLKRKMDRLNLRGILFHKKGANSNSLPQDMLDNIETGAILEGDKDEDLIRVNPNYITNDVITSLDKIFEFARMINGITAQGTGEDLPANTPATIGMINQQVAKTAFDKVTENFGIFLTKLFQQLVMPDIIEELDAEDWVNITGDPEDLKEFDKVLVPAYLYGVNGNPGAIKMYEQAQGMPMMPMEIKQKEQGMMTGLDKMGDQRWTQITKELLKKLDYITEFYVTNESFNKQVMIQNLLAMVKDPLFPGSRQKVYAYILDLMNMAGRRFNKSEDEIRQEIQQQMMISAAKGGMTPGGGGGMPAPAGEVARQVGQAGNPLTTPAQ